MMKGGRREQGNDHPLRCAGVTAAPGCVAIDVRDRRPRRAKRASLTPTGLFLWSCLSPAVHPDPGCTAAQVGGSWILHSGRPTVKCGRALLPRTAAVSVCEAMSSQKTLRRRPPSTRVGRSVARRVLTSNWVEDNRYVYKYIQL